MQIKVTVTFTFKDSSEKEVTWIEKDPKLIQRDESTKEVLSETVLKAPGVQKEYTRLISRMMQENKVFSIENSDGVSFIVPLTEVKYLHLKAETIADDEQDNNIIKELNLKPKRHKLN